MSEEMSFTAVFVDTCIFESMNFQFSSDLSRAFETACVSAGVRLLMPDAIDREINRHIDEKVALAIESLRTLNRKNPILRQWDLYPSVTEVRDAEGEFKLRMRKEWSDFRKRLSCHDLGCDDIDLNQVMNWYDNIDPPFGPGKKRKEFPDAFAISSLLSYAKNTREYISVITFDSDIVAACEGRDNLICFGSLAGFSDNLLESSMDTTEIRIAIESGLRTLEGEILDESMELEVFHSDENVNASLLEVTSCKLKRRPIVSIGRRQCTIVFEAEIEAGVKLNLEHGLWEDEFGEIDNIFHIPVVIEGSAKLCFTEDLRSFEIRPEIRLDYGDFEADIDLKKLYI